jgi:transposase InsO family protein
MHRHGHYSVLNIVCKVCKWVICISCDTAMGSEDLCKLLYDKGFLWIALPLKIVGDRDTHLRASQTRALCNYLGIPLLMSTAYHPQTDGQSGNFNKTL